MLRKLLVTAATGLVATAVVTAPADAAVASARTPAPAVSAARCHSHKVGKHWECVTPGSYCPKAAHLHYGYAYKTGKRYRCVRYPNGQWRWKRG
ncbi:hypothetical protein DZF91_11930 [Actinomadura logoneensis]|uniref:Uncharacterized protein n=1 Tax=Actinomadura logoneensis TaxID=2293572 RepID=A0A372JN20_9ACTN|nr:hypothetical protein [Actinomadura logoneensis]RFU41412.1 hypothetical protein DZF91_11930 [Actinomadura logoneensis]